MTTDVPFIKPKAPFVIVTRKGGFPAATLVEAQRVVRPLVTDEKTSITDAAGRKYTAREFLNAAQQAADTPSTAKAPLPTDLKDWASATADIDLDGEAPPGWKPPPPTPSRGAPAAARSSARIPSPGARGRPTSDRRPSGVQRRRDDEGSATKALMVVGIVVLAVGIIAVIWSLQARPAADPTPHEAPPPATRPTTPAQPTLTPDGRVRPEDRPLPTYMR